MSTDRMDPKCCPFCGADTLPTEYDEDEAKWVIECTECGAEYALYAFAVLGGERVPKDSIIEDFLTVCRTAMGAIEASRLAECGKRVKRLSSEWDGLEWSEVASMLRKAVLRAETAGYEAATT
jgi:hypothetical protein